MGNRVGVRVGSLVGSVVGTVGVFVAVPTGVTVGVAVAVGVTVAITAGPSMVTAPLIAVPGTEAPLTLPKLGIGSPAKMRRALMVVPAAGWQMVRNAISISGVRSGSVVKGGK